MSGPILEHSEEVNIEPRTNPIDGSLYDMHRGLLPRVLDFIFHRIAVQEQNLEKKVEFVCKVSYMEIYNERPFDLLEPDAQNLIIREDSRIGVYVENLKEVVVTSSVEALRLAVVGAKNRRVAATAMNRESSRSHSLFCLHIASKETCDGITRHRSSRFHLCDLAGSERQSSTQTVGTQLVEAGAINKSLSILGNVIMSLVDIANGKTRHVHYRDSKLTFLLKDSLGGNSMTFVVANVSPAEANLQETLSTLKFAARAKFIKNNAQVNEDTSASVGVLLEEIKRLKEQLQMGVAIPSSLSESQFSNAPLTGSAPFSSPLLVDQGATILNVPNFMMLHRYSQKQSNLFQEVGRLKEQLGSFTELVAGYELELNNQKLIGRLRTKELDSLTASMGSMSDATREKTFISRIELLKAELDILHRNQDLSPAAVSWCLRFSMLEEKIENEAPWLLENARSNSGNDPTSDLRHALGESRIRNDSLMRDLTELLSNYEMLRKEHESQLIQNPDVFWSKLPASFKMAIPEIRDATTAKNNALKRVESLKSEKEAMQHKIHELELKKIDLERLEGDMDLMKVLHQRELSHLQIQMQENINVIVSNAVAECSEKYISELAGGESQMKSVQIENVNLQSKISGLESDLQLAKKEVVAMHQNTNLMEQSISNLQTRLEDHEGEMARVLKSHAELLANEVAKQEKLNEEIVRIQTSSFDLTSQLRSLQNQLLEANAKFEDSQSQLLVSNISLANIKLQLEAECKLKLEISNEYQSKLFDFDSLQQDNETLVETNNTLTAKINELQLLTRAENTARDAEVKKLNTLIACLETQVTEAQQALIAKSSSENEQITWLTSEREKHILEINLMQNQLVVLKEAQAEELKRCLHLNEALEVMKDKEAGYIEAISSFNFRIESLQKKISEFEAENLLLTSNLERLQAASVAMEIDSVQKEIQYSELLEENKNLSSSILQIREQKDEENRELKVAAGALDERVADLQHFLTFEKSKTLKLERELAATKDASSEKVTRLNEDFQLQIKLIEYERQTLDTKLQLRESEIERVKQEAFASNRELTERAEKREAELQSQTEDLQNALMSLTTQYNQQELSLGRLSEKIRKAHTEYETNMTEKLTLIGDLNRNVSELKGLSVAAEEKVQSLQLLLETLKFEHNAKEIEWKNELQSERDLCASADVQIQYLESRVSNYEAQLKNYEDLVSSRLEQKNEVAERLERFMQLEALMFAEKETREDENLKLKEKIRVLEAEIDKMHKNLDSAVEEKFKLAQSKNHLQRIHLLDDTKKKLDSTMADLSAERDRVKQLQIKLKRSLRSGADKESSENAESEAAWLEAEMMRQMKLERGIVTLVRLVRGDYGGDEKLEIKPEELSEESLTSTLDKVVQLVAHNRILSEKVMDDSRKQILEEVAILSQKTKTEVSNLRTRLNSITSMSELTSGTKGKENVHE